MPARTGISSFYCRLGAAPFTALPQQLTRSPKMAIAELPPQSARFDRESPGLRFERYFTHAGQHPHDLLDWELLDAVIPGDGGNVFEQKGAEGPAFWSVTATHVGASKDFRGNLGRPPRGTRVLPHDGRGAG